MAEIRRDTAVLAVAKRAARVISVLVANAKGGCGKTTIATNLASAFANAGLRTALAEGDRQRSARSWLERRPASAAPIAALDWRAAAAPPPDGLDRLVIDAGPGLDSRRVRELLAQADLLAMPVLPSFFDEAATRRFLKRVERLKPVRRGRKPVAVVANRVQAGTRAAAELASFLAGLGHEVAARLAGRALYQEVARRGLGIFDLPPGRRAGAVEDWLPLIRLIEDRRA